jgi:putative phage-type endonuclease
MMATQVKLVQGSSEWHEHRANYRNASETSAVMGVNPWMTPFQLWEIKTGRAKPPMNAAMARGTQLEPLAREAYEALTGHVAQPLVLVDSEYSASLDGMTFDGSLIVEIKCPMKGRESTLWKSVSEGSVPESYGWQIEHQLMVSGAHSGHLFVFDGDSGEGLLHEINPEPKRWDQIRSAWEAFMEFIQSDTPPPLTDQDKRIRNDPDWMVATELYLHLKRKADSASAELDEAKAALLRLASHYSETGNGVTVTRFWKSGNVDYKKIPELSVIDLDAYRAKGRFETRITINK